MKATLIGPEILRQHRQTNSSAVARSKKPTRAWPQRPGAGVLSERIPLFFISRDGDGFWLARHADLPIGGLFLFQRSAMRFAKQCSEPMPCATMILAEPHALDTDNRGNRLAAQLRPAMRLARNLNAFVAAAFTKARALGACISRARIEDRMLRAAMELELYSRRYKHSNKNEDDLPMVR